MLRSVQKTDLRYRKIGEPNSQNKSVLLLPSNIFGTITHYWPISGNYTTIEQDALLVALDCIVLSMYSSVKHIVKKLCGSKL